MTDKYPKISFRPTGEMHEIIQEQKRLTGLSTSEVMRQIVSDYIIFLKETKNGD